MVERVILQTAAYERLAKKYGLTSEQDRLLGAARYRWDLIERDIAALLNRRKDLPAGRKGTYPEPLVNYLASIYLNCCFVEKCPPPQSLLFLVSQQLEIANFGIKGGKRDALEQARQIRSIEPTISNRALARRLKVDPATVGRWVNGGLLQPADA